MIDLDDDRWRAAALALRATGAVASRWNEKHHPRRPDGRASGQRRQPGGEVRHFVGQRHPRDPKGQWTEYGPGGTKGKNPLRGMSTGKAPNGVRWQTVPDNPDAVILESYAKTSAGTSGKVVGVATYGDGSSKLRLLDDSGSYHDVNIGDLVQYAPRPARPRKPTRQLIEERRGPKPVRARSADGDVGGNGVAPYLLDDLPPVEPGVAQVDAVWARHRQFLPNIDKMAYHAVSTREQMLEADTGRVARGATEPAAGLAVRPLYPSPMTKVMIHDKYVDDYGVELGQRSGYTSVNNARTQAEAYAAHEIGHAIDFHLNDGERREVFETLARELDLPAPVDASPETLDAWVKAHGRELSRKVSSYGTTNSLEILAEIWAEYALSTKNSPPYPWVEAVGDVMRRAAVTK